MRGLRPGDVEALVKVFRGYSSVAAVYLFGSLATGSGNPTSDLDLAVVPKDQGVRRQKLDMLADLVEAGFENVDLVILDSGDIVLDYAAISPNELVYADESFDRGRAYSLAVRRYLDFLPYLDRQRRVARSRLLRG